MHLLVFIITFILGLNSINLMALDFDGYPCTDDCSGHTAGYEWASQNRVSDEYDCTSKSKSFTEGCVSYVQGGAGLIGNNLFGNRGTTQSLNSNPFGGRSTSVFGQPARSYAPKQLTPTQQEEFNLEQAEAQRFAEADYIVQGIMSDPRWIDGTYQRREELMEKWKAENWPAYAQFRWGQNYQLNPEAQASWLQISGALERGCNEKLNEVEGASSLGNIMGSIGQTADRLYDSMFLPAVPDMIGLKSAQDDLLRTQRQLDLVRNSSSFSQEQKDQYIASLESQLPGIQARIAENEKDLEGPMSRYMAEVQKSTLNEQARQEGNALRANRAMRIQELIKQGSNSPFL